MVCPVDVLVVSGFGLYNQEFPPISSNNKPFLTVEVYGVCMSIYVMFFVVQVFNSYEDFEGNTVIGVGIE